MNHDEFTILDLFKDLGIGFEGQTHEFVWNSLVSKTHDTNNPNHIIVLVKERMDQTMKFTNHGAIYRLTPTAIYNYIDYMEIVEARKAANEAKQQAFIAIQLSAYSLIIAVILGLFGSFLTIIQILKD